MKKELYFKKFSSFWINCRTNNTISLLSTYDDSYITMAAMNNYTYNVSGRTDYFRSLAVYRADEFHNNLKLLRTENIYFKSNDYVDEMKKYIDAGEYVSVLVDLYYWKESAYQYHKEHTFHYSLCIGYDDDTEMFFFDDGDVDIPSFLEIPYQLFEKAIVLKDNKLSGLRMSLPQVLPTYHFRFSDVLNNAQLILNNLNSISFSSHWSVYGDVDKYGIMMFYSEAVIHRQKANRILLDILLKKEYISSSEHDELMRLVNPLIDNWQKFKNQFIKAFYTKKTLELKKYNNTSFRLLLDEKELWETLLKMHTADSNGICCSPVKSSLRSSIKADSDIQFNSIEAVPYKKEDGLLYSKLIITYDNVSGRLKKTDDVKLPYKLVPLSRDSFEFLPEFIEEVHVVENKVYLKTNILFQDTNGIETFVLSSRDNICIVDDNQHKLPVLFDQIIKDKFSYSSYVNHFNYGVVDFANNILSNDHQYSLDFTENISDTELLSDTILEPIVIDTCYFHKKDTGKQAGVLSFSFKKDSNKTPVRLHVFHRYPFIIWNNHLKIDLEKYKSCLNQRDKKQICMGKNNTLISETAIDIEPDTINTITILTTSQEQDIALQLETNEWGSAFLAKI